MGLPAGWETSSHIPLLLLLPLLFLILSFLASLRHYSCLPLWWSCNSNHSALITRQRELTHTYTLTVGSPHYQSMSLAAGDRQVRLILRLFFVFSPDILSLLNLTLCLSLFPTPAFPSPALLRSPRQPGGQIGARLS